MNTSLNSAGGKRQLRFRGDMTGSRVEELHHQQEEIKQKAPLAQDDVAAMAENRFESEIQSCHKKSPQQHDHILIL